MRNRKLTLIMAFVLITAIVVGCSAGSTKSEYVRDVAPSEGRASMEIADESYGYGEKTSDDGYYEPDKIITTISISMETLEFDETTKKLDEIIKKYKGYVETSHISHNNYIHSSRLKSANYEIRIPRENLDNFVKDIKAIGNIISENTSKQDITKRYRDTESRLRVLETKEERILALLEKAEKMEDIIALENQLSEIIYQKENLTADLMEMDDKVDYSTVHLELREVAKLTPGENEKTPFFTKLANAFKNSIYYFSQNIESFLISLVYFLPYGIIIGVLVYLIRKFLRKRNMKLPRINKKDGE